VSFLYFAFGLGLASNQFIPGLVALQAIPVVDVQVWLHLLPLWLEEIPEEMQQVWYVSSYRDDRSMPVMRAWKLRDGAYFRVLYSDRTQFIINRAGTEIWATWPDNLTLEDTATYLLGPIIGFLLRLRGVTCLHASAVAVGDKCLAIIGPSGAGKSTTAAAFAKAGFAILADDVVALLDGNTGLSVQPAYPRLRLWGESVKALYGSPDSLPLLTPNWNKRYLDSGYGLQFRSSPLPLGGIYILGDRITSPAAPFIETVPAHTGLITLVANTYASTLIDKSMRGQEFDLLSRVVNKLPLRRVTPHADPAYLSKLCDLILEDFQKLANN